MTVKKPKRRLNNWIKSWLDFFSQTEVPTNYAFWTGIWTLSAALKDQVYIERGDMKLYPNIYVWLIGPGSNGKGYAAKYGLEMIESLSITNTYIGRMSCSWMVTYLQKAAVQQSLATQGVSNAAHLALYSDELINTIGTGQQVHEVLSMMTQLYNYKYMDGTHLHDMRVVEKPVISWLAGTTVPWLRKAMPGSLVDSGATARIISVFEKLTRKIVPFPPKMDKILYQDLLVDLAIISTLEGDYNLTSDAKDRWIEWYEQDHKKRQGIEDDVTIGIYGREHDAVLKTSMAMSAAVSNDLTITLPVLSQSIAVVELARQSNVQLYRSLAVGDLAIEQKAYIKSQLEQNGGEMDQADLMRAVSGRIGDITRFDAIIKTLMAEQIIQATGNVGQLKFKLQQLQPQNGVP